MKNRDSYKRVAQAIKKAKRIALCVHAFPDGDALGSMAALALGIKKLNKRFELFSPTELPRRYGFLPFYGRIRGVPKQTMAFDLAIAIDCATPLQLGGLYRKVFAPSAETVEIDHHVFRKRFAAVSLVEARAAAVGEIIYGLLGFLKVKVDKALAQALLVSIIVETGSFRLPSVRAETFEVCADLVGRGIDYYKIVEKSYWSRTKAEAALLGLCFSRVKFLKKGKVALSYVTLKDMKRLGARQEDVDPMADQIRTLKDVKVVLLFREMPHQRWRVSLRSKGLINVGRVAEEFGGGGHQDVAGCLLEKSAKEKDRLLRKVEALV